jgi:integrase
MKMRDKTRMFCRNGTYYFRAKIPEDVQKHYRPGQKEIKFSLKTKDRNLARRLVDEHSLRVENDHEAFRQLAKPTRTIELTPDFLESFPKLWMHEFFRFDDHLRFNGLSREEFELHGKGITGIEARTADDLARGDVALTEKTLRYFLRNRNLTIVPEADPKAYRTLLLKLLKVQRLAFKAQQERQRGEVVETPPAPHIAEVSDTSGEPAQDENPLTNVLKRWAKERQPKSKTLHEFGLVVRRFVELHGDLPVQRITRGQVVALKNKLVEEGKAPGTIIKQLGGIRAILQWAYVNDAIHANPADRVSVAVAKVQKKSRVSYEVEDLNHIFSLPVFTEGERPTGGAGEAAYWLPILSLFTGARESELGQLRGRDVKRSADGIDFIELTDEAEGGSVKTNTSRRRVPLHPDVIHLGFLQFAKKTKGDAPLFPELRADVHGVITGNWSKWYGRYIRANGLTDPRKVFHSFRHSFKDACREAGIDESIHDALTGHAGGGEGRSYGGEMHPLAPLAKAIKKVRYKGLKLPA